MVRSQPILIREAEPADAEALTELAARTFWDTFAATNGAEDMAVHLARSYSPAQQLAEITAPGTRTLLAVADAVIAYAMLRVGGETPECVQTSDPVEIWRFYVDQGWHGRGVAQLLMQGALAEARAAGARSVWLGVWEHNPRAQAFYRKFGFVAVGAHDFLFGHEVQTDLIMVLDPLPG